MFNNAMGFAFFDIQGDILDGFHLPAPHLLSYRQVFDIQNRSIFSDLLAGFSHLYVPKNE